jgi:hypothetical protein
VRVIHSRPKSSDQLCQISIILALTSSADVDSNELRISDSSTDE